MQTLSKWVLMVISLLWVTFSHAQRVVPVPALTAYQQECSVCHFAYPPGLLPPNSWKNITDALPKHFTANVLLNSDTQSDCQLVANQCHQPRVGRYPNTA
jgi:hypothetical protein